LHVSKFILYITKEPLSVIKIKIVSFCPVTEVVELPTGDMMCQQKQAGPYVLGGYILTIVDSVITLLLPLLCVTAMMVAITLSIIHTYRWRRSSPGSQKRRAELMRIPQVCV
jgi:hypothetical protein